MDQFIAGCLAFGAWFTFHTTLNVMSLLIGAVVGTLFELPLIGRLRRG